MEFSSEFNAYKIIENDNIKEFDLLMSKDISLLNETFLGDSLLHIAASKGKLSLCERIINLGLDVNITASHYLTPLVEAARNGHLNVILLLLQKGALVDGDPRGITTPLIESSMAGFSEVVEVLIAHGADINRLQTKFNCTALDIAITYKSVIDTVNKLRENGAKHSREPIDLGGVSGSGILAHIYDNVGVIITDEYVRDNISIKTSLIGEGKKYIKNKLLFTFGNFIQKPRKEFIICLPYDWPINRQVLDGDYEEGFPLKFLFLLSDLYKNGMDIKEGTVLEKSNPTWCQLKWPENIDALVAVDYAFDHREKEQNLKDETVELLLFTPIKYTKAGRPHEDKLNEWIAKQRIAKWERVSFKNEWLLPS